MTETTDRTPDYAAALRDLDFARDSHLKWAEHLEAHEASGQPCEECASKPYKLTAPYEREWVAKYDRIIAIVKAAAALPPASEGTPRCSGEPQTERLLTARIHCVQDDLPEPR